MLLERLFENLSVRVEPFAVCEVGRDWRLRMDALGWVTLHFVMRGEGRLRVGSGETYRLRPYTLAVVPSGQEHAIEGAGQPVDEMCARLSGSADRLDRFSTSEATTGQLTVACGRIQVMYGHGVGLFDLLTEPLVLDFSGSPAMVNTFRRLLDETDRQGPASSAMMAALMSECLVLVFRALCDQPECPLPWLTALDDPRLASALGAVLDRPERAHSVQSLADVAAMSRSAFAREFAAGFGRTPMAFVRDVRVRRAAELLRTTELAVEAVASRVGITSRSHFTRAFRDYFGQSPMDYRRGARAALLMPPGMANGNAPRTD